MAVIFIDIIKSTSSNEEKASRGAATTSNTAARASIQSDTPAAMEEQPIEEITAQPAQPAAQTITRRRRLPWIINYLDR